IDNVRIYSGPLSQSQLRLDMATAVSSLIASAGPAESGNEGAAIGFSGSVSGGTAPYTYSWSFGDGGTGTGTLTPTHVYAHDGSYTATLAVTDGGGNTSLSSTAVTVNDVGPTVQAGGPYSGVPGAAISFAASASDPNPADTAGGFTYTWAFGDGA